MSQHTPFTPHNIFLFKDRQERVTKGFLTFKLFSDGWLVRFTPDEGLPVSAEGVDVYSACRFANDRL